MVLYGKTKTLMWIIQIRSWLNYIKVYQFITSFENILSCLQCYGQFSV